MKQTLAQQIEATRRRLVATKPRSRLRIELELRLRDLMTRQLAVENRMDRKRAA